ncbi:MAG TPA: PAS domain S-box protein, partial [Desulfobacteraceae bacterium]|nr:PAS domain S-box protein [Desulfobacteraceae bacterium]
MTRTDSKSTSSPKSGEQPSSGKASRIDSSLNIAIAGAGQECVDLLDFMSHSALWQSGLNILGVADTDPEAPGIIYAGEMNISTFSTFQDLCQLKGLNLIIDLTGDEKAVKELNCAQPPGCSVIDRRGAQLLLGLFTTEAKDAGAKQEVRPELEELQKYQKILDSLPDQIMVINKDMSIDMVNKAFLNETGLTREEVLGKGCHEVRYGLDTPCSPCCLDEVKKRKKTTVVYKKYLDHEGRERFDFITGAPILDDQGNLVQLLESTKDATARVQLEGEAQQTGTFLQNVIQSIVDGIVVVDTKGMVLLFNEGMERLTGYPAEEIMNKGHLSSFY